MLALFQQAIWYNYVWNDPSLREWLAMRARKYTLLYKTRGVSWINKVPPSEVIEAFTNMEKPPIPDYDDPHPARGSSSSLATDEASTSDKSVYLTREEWYTKLALLDPKSQVEAALWRSTICLDCLQYRHRGVPMCEDITREVKTG